MCLGSVAPWMAWQPTSINRHARELRWRTHFTQSNREKPEETERNLNKRTGVAGGYKRGTKKEQSKRIRVSVCSALHFSKSHPLVLTEILMQSLARSVRNDANPPGPAGHPPFARGTFTLPPLLKGGAAAAAEGFGSCSKPSSLWHFLCYSVFHSCVFLFPTPDALGWSKDTVRQRALLLPTR